jgi:hypothetical protein
MPKQNNLVSIEVKKPFEIVQELKDYEIKKSPLSLTARDKVINKSGGNYISDNKGYGPMPNDGEELRGYFPFIATLLEYNRNGTIAFLKANGAFKVEFSGSSEIRLSSFDSDKLRQIESMISVRGIGEMKRYINERYPR